MNQQLVLSLDLQDKSITHHYRGFEIVCNETVAQRRISRTNATRRSGQTFGEEYFEFSYWETRIYKQGSKYSGQRIVGEKSCCYREIEALEVTKAWIDIWEYGEKEKHRYRGNH